jgi:adenylate cyclase
MFSAMPAPSLAVVPFANPSGDPEKTYLAEGFAEDLCVTLGQVAALSVAPWTSAVDAWKATADAGAVARALQVSHALSGSIRRTATRVELSVAVVEANGATCWAERVDRAADELVKVRQEVLAKVIAALAVPLSEAERRGTERAPTTSARAFELFLRGRHASQRLLRRTQEYARDLYQEALGLDAQFARAHAGLALCYALLANYWDTSPEMLRRADEASARAVELDPDLAETRVARGFALSLAKRYSEADQEFAAALKLHPRSYDAEYYFARNCRAQGRLEEAARHFAQASALKPEDYQTLAMLASTYAGLQRAEESRAAQLKALELTERRLKLDPDDARALYLGAVAFSAIGERAKARDWAKRAIAMDPDDSAVLYNVACVYSLLGLADSAIDCLEQAVNHGFGHWEWVAHDPDLNPLRQHPRFQALLPRS